MKTALVLVDTYAEPGIVRHALGRCLDGMAVDDCMVYSDRELLPGTRWLPIDPIRSMREYERIILERVVQDTHCDSHLVVQWDGFLVEPKRWEPEFAQYDYVGAPWPHLGGLVGNGGFSLRSRRLLEAWRALPPDPDEARPAEDLQICITRRPQLEALGVRFPEAGLAARFSVETPGPSGLIGSFGFHGAFNFPLVMTEAEILEHWPGIMVRMGKASNMWFLFLWNALVRGHLTVARALAGELMERRPEVWEELAPVLRQRGVPAGLVERGPGIP